MFIAPSPKKKIDLVIGVTGCPGNGMAGSELSRMHTMAGLQNLVPFCVLKSTLGKLFIYTLSLFAKSGPNGVLILVVITYTPPVL